MRCWHTIAARPVIKQSVSRIDAATQPRNRQAFGKQADNLALHESGLSCLFSSTRPAQEAFQPTIIPTPEAFCCVYQPCRNPIATCIIVDRTNRFFEIRLQIGTNRKQKTRIWPRPLTADLQWQYSGRAWKCSPTLFLTGLQSPLSSEVNGSCERVYRTE